MLSATDTAPTTASAIARSHYPPPPINRLRVAPDLSGFGTETHAGRGGKLLVVTTLDSDGPGSFLEAIATPGPRQIIFDVAGVITMPPGGLTIDEGHVSVYGQTAPGEGIELRAHSGDGYPNINIRASHVFLQYLRIRTGAGPVKEGGWPIRDGLNIGNHDSPISHIVLDHITASWGTDETIDCFGATSDVTLSNCLIYENLVRSTDDYRTSGRSVLFGDRSHRLSMYGCVIAKSTGRLPMMQSVHDFDIFNNLFYGYTKSASEVQVASAHDVTGNIESNLYIDTHSTSRAEVFVYPKAHGGAGNYQIFLANNGRMRLRRQGEIKPIRVRDSIGNSIVNMPMTPMGQKGFPSRPPEIALAQLEDALLEHVGASRPTRDKTDKRVISEIRNRTGQMVDCVNGAVVTPENRNCWRNVHHISPTTGPSRLGPPPDYVPLAWKRQVGLKPTTDSRILDSNQDGYTDFEDWLHSLS